MTRTDQKIIFSALGFLAVIIRDVPNDKQAQRAKAIAQLIENFCTQTVAEEAATNGDKPSALAALFANLIPNNQNNKDLVREALQALEQCLNDDQQDLFASTNDTSFHGLLV